MWIGDFYYQIPTKLPELSITSVYFVVFVIAVFLLARLFQNRLRSIVLLFANIFFVYSFGVNHLKLLLIITAIAYLSGLVLNKYRNSFTLGLPIIIVVIILCYFKYNGFLFGTSVVAPLGLSFYIFKAISYLVDIFKEKTKAEYNPLYFADYLMFFPCITAGPINRAKPFLEEIRTFKQVEYSEFVAGVSLILFGIFEKIVMCDFIGHISSNILNNHEIVGLNVLFGMVLYSFQIYLDFDSYSNISIGAARLLGFNIPKNFNSPYLGSSLKEFWNRWHISLSSWLKDYIYIPLGGNRKGKIRMYINIIIVFVISGIWHGSTLNFLLWGLLHGIIRVVEDYIAERIRYNNYKQVVKLFLKPFGILFNFAIVTFLWLIFKYQTIGEVIEVLNRINFSTSLDLISIGMTKLEIEWMWIVLLSVIVTDILRNYVDVTIVFSKLWFVVRWPVYLVLIVIFLIFGQYGGSFDANDFIYRWF